jgi:hypothetical protein
MTIEVEREIYGFNHGYYYEGAARRLDEAGWGCDLTVRKAGCLFTLKIRQ